MIVDHVWFCIRCNKKFTLAVEMFDTEDRQKLDNAYSQITLHVLTNGEEHQVIHKEKPRGFNPRIV